MNPFAKLRADFELRERFERLERIEWPTFTSDHGLRKIDKIELSDLGDPAIARSKAGKPGR